MDENKKKQLEQAILQIEKQFGKGSIMKLGDEVQKPIDVIHLDKEKFCGLKKNLTMDCSSIKKYDIFFKSSIDNIKNALQRPFRTK